MRVGTTEPTARWRRVLAAVGVLAYFKKTQRAGISDDVPAVAGASNRVAELADRALELGEAGREDKAAVEELIRLAYGRAGSLRRAAAAIRSNGWHHEYRGADCANRLLLAAATGGPISEVPPEQERVFAWTDRLRADSPEQGFAMLAEREPRLLAVRDAIVTQAREQADTERVWDLLIEALQPMLGPQSESGDALLRTPLSFGTARVAIARAAGLTFED